MEDCHPAGIVHAEHPPDPENTFMLYFLLAIMVLIWAANFVIAKNALEEIPPFALLVIRIWISNLLLLTFFFLKGKHRNYSLQRGDWRWFAWLGFLGVAVNQAGFTVGIHYTTIGHGALIFGLGPVFVLILAVWMKLEKLTLQKWLGLSFAFLGVVLLASEHGFTSESPTLLGDAIILFGVLGFSLYTAFGKKVSARYDTLTLNTFVFIAGLVFVTPMASWQLFQTDWSAVTWKGWFGAFYMASMASVAAYMIFYYALTKISVTRLSMLSYFQPVLATTLGVIFLGEKITSYLLGSGALILFGVFLANRGRGKLAVVPPAD